MQNKLNMLRCLTNLTRTSNLYCSHLKRNLHSTIPKPTAKVAAVVGVYEGDDESYITTEATSRVDQLSSGKLLKQLNCGKKLKAGKSRVLYDVCDEYPIVAVVGLRGKDKPLAPSEERDEVKESVRTAIAAGCTSLQDTGVSIVSIDPCGDIEAAAEGGHLSNYIYQELKSKKKDRPQLKPFGELNDGWYIGSALAEGQNISRKLMESPANIITPTNFAQEAVNHLEKLGVEVRVRSYEWAKEMKMNSFLSVSKGSAEPPVFLEIIYNGHDDRTIKPLAIVGKGITFDAGGISLKQAKGMDKMRADMGGAACTVGAIYTAASLKIPLNIKGFIPLCENLPSGTANKPGDVVVASNGKTIEIDNTDAEGRLILADALHYASQHKPRAIIDMATLTGAIMVALGAGATGAFSNSTELWNLMQRAGATSGDRVWRMPLWELYSQHVNEFGLADVHNVGKYSGYAGSCTAAAFLKEFVTCDHWMHLDIAGVMENNDEVPYLGKGMSGRPTRTIANFIQMFAKQSDL